MAMGKPYKYTLADIAIVDSGGQGHFELEVLIPGFDTLLVEWIGLDAAAAIQCERLAGQPVGRCGYLSFYDRIDAFMQRTLES